MCQLDALKRLKCERHVVLKALKNLPKTLEETYDRIFITIPEEERMFVHLVLRWIAHHNGISGGDGIPCDVLIQAVAASTAELTGEQNERYYDKDTLREICGCLVDIMRKDTHMNETCPQYSAVNFAHYTVREYLDSGRISKSALIQCSAVEGFWTEQFIKSILSEAQNVRRKGSLRLFSSYRKFDILGAVTSNFTDYCVTFVIGFLYGWAEHICGRDILKKLAFDLVDPSKPHFDIMTRVASALDLYRRRSSPWLWEIEWHPETSTEVKHLFNLLLLYEDHKGYSSLVESFLRNKDQNFLQSRLLFGCHMHPYFSYQGPSIDTIRIHGLVSGSFFDVFALLQCEFPDVFPYLMEIGAGVFDPSVALLLSVGGHPHDSACEEFCVVLRLLEIGADPNLKGYIVTPLQIAVYCLDFEAVNTLLEHGAHPNSTGCEEGVAWEKRTFMSQINHLHGASPLRINRKYTLTGCFEYIYEQQVIEDVRKKVEALLLQHGAQEISTSYTAALDEEDHARYAKRNGDKFYKRLSGLIPLDLPISSEDEETSLSETSIDSEDS